TSLSEFSEFLRRKTYLLSNALEAKSKILNNCSSTLKTQLAPKVPKRIVTPIAKEIMAQEVEFLRNSDCRLLQSKKYEVFLTRAEKIPSILREIGRLREITFREVGEGTNESIDLDTFDTYYHHMF